MFEADTACKELEELILQLNTYRISEVKFRFYYKGLFNADMQMFLIITKKKVVDLTWV